AAHRPRRFGQLLGPENDEGDRQDHQELGRDQAAHRDDCTGRGRCPRWRDYCWLRAPMARSTPPSSLRRKWNSRMSSQVMAGPVWTSRISAGSSQVRSATPEETRTSTTRWSVGLVIISRQI